MLGRHVADKFKSDLDFQMFGFLLPLLEAAATITKNHEVVEPALDSFDWIVGWFGFGAGFFASGVEETGRGR
jgi:hypothetical protein